MFVTLYQLMGAALPDWYFHLRKCAPTTGEFIQMLQLHTTNIIMQAAKNPYLSHHTCPMIIIQPLTSQLGSLAISPTIFHPPNQCSGQASPSTRKFSPA